MKLLITLIICYLFCSIIYPQGGEGETYPENELNIQIQNVPTDTITFEFIPIGANWADSTGCNFRSYNDDTTYISSLITEESDSGYIDCWYNGYEYRFYNQGNHTVVSNCAQSTAGLQPLRNGFYRMNIKENGQLKTYAYFDWRDTGFPDGVCRWCSGGNDMTIRYDGEEDEIWFWNSGSIRYENQDPHAFLTPGQIISWAELNCTPRTTSYLEDFWDNALVLVNDGNDHPLLVWGPYPDEDFAVQYYRVYKKEGSSNFQIVHTTTELDWIDTDETIVTGPRQANEGICYYKITAVGLLQDEPIETGYTNTVDTRVEGDPLEKIGYNSSNRLVEEFSLHQNYPNPFNPTTQIKYSIQRDGFVLLKVYDILGNEVAALVEEPKLAGNHTVDFNASDLPSGIYFYQLQSENFTDTKKMILLR